MTKELQNIKTLIDLAITRGLFNNAESVQAVLDSYRHIATMVEGQASFNHSERTMPEKSTVAPEIKMPI
jgi:hypothetical protein